MDSCQRYRIFRIRRTQTQWETRYSSETREHVSLSLTVEHLVLIEVLSSVPGDVGRSLVQKYFEAEHTNTAVIHPQVKSPDFAPETPTKKSKKHRHHSRRSPSKQNHLTGAYPSAPTFGCFYPPVYGPYMGEGGAPGPAYSFRYAPSSSGLVQPPDTPRTFINDRGEYLAYPSRGHESFPFRY